MAGYCSSVNEDLWYQLADGKDLLLFYEYYNSQNCCAGVLRWFYINENGVKIERGRQDMSLATEVLGYCTEPIIQTRFLNCFMIVFLDKEIHLGVLGKKAKDQWIVALMSSMEAASRSRFAYRWHMFCTFFSRNSLDNVIVIIILTQNAQNASPGPSSSKRRSRYFGKRGRLVDQ